MSSRYGQAYIIHQLYRVEPERMMGGERTRAYRYGMTLLCVGALFNWLGLTENNSDPVKFIGYTCLASGALLVCMAICFWASSAHRLAQNQVRPEQNNDTVVNIDGSRIRGGNIEKPPDYETVADLSPPPSYDDAIRLSPVYLPSTCGTDGPSVEANRDAEAHGPIQAQVCINIIPSNTVNKSPNGSPKPDSSPLTRVIRLSSRLLRRTLSNADPTDEEISSNQRPITDTEIHRSNSAQDIKIT